MKRGLMLVFSIVLLIFVSSMIIADSEVEINLDEQESETAKAIADLPEPGILPTSMFYGFKTAFQNIRLALLRNEAKERYRLRLLDIRLAELNGLQELSETLNASGKPVEKIEAKMERLTERYEKQLEVSEERVEKLRAIGRNVTALQKHVANRTRKHVFVLQRVAEKVPVQARVRILRAINKSIEGNERAVAAVFKSRGLTANEAEELLVEAKERYKARIQNRTEAVACIQVMTQAYNSDTGECKVFATPCDVPQGWKKGACKIKALKADVVAIKQNIKAFRQNITKLRKQALQVRAAGTTTSTTAGQTDKPTIQESTRISEGVAQQT